MTDGTLPAQALEAAREARSRGDLEAGLAHALRARELAALPADRAIAGHLACFFHLRLGQLADVIALGESVAAALDVVGAAAERSEVLRWLTLAAVELGRFDVALRAADLGFRAAMQANDANERALAFGALGACYERMGDSWQAERLMLDGLAQAEAAGAVYQQAVSLNNLGSVCIGEHYAALGVNDAAARDALRRGEAYLRRASGLVGQLTEPILAVLVEGNLGEVLLHQGHLDEARSLLDSALAACRRYGYAAYATRIRCSQGELQLACGQPAQALEGLQGLIDEATEGLPQSTALRVHHGLYRASKVLGRLEQALHHLERYDGLQRERAMRQLKAQSELLVTRLEVERLHQDAQAERARSAELAQHANHDPLTGLGNRRHLDHFLPGLLAHAREHLQPLSLALLDIDWFKQINDSHGHLVGDRVLIEFAQMLRDNTRHGDLLARIGGEEFLIVLPDTPLPRALEVCERLRERVAARDWSGIAPGLSMTTSIGVAQTPPMEQSALFGLADSALYRAKRAGRNRVAF